MPIVGPSNQGIELGRHSLSLGDGFYRYGDAFFRFLTNTSETKVLLCGYSELERSATTSVLYALRFTTVFSFPIAVARGSTFSNAILELPVVNARSGLTFVVQAYRDQNSADASAANYSHLQPKGASSIVFNTANLSNYNSAYEPWFVDGNKITLNIKTLLEEAVAHPSWGDSLGVLRIAISPGAYASPSSNIGDISFYYDEAPSFLGASINYTVNPTATMTSVSDDDSIAAGELNVPVVGTNLDAVNSVSLYNRDTDREYGLTLSSKTPTLLRFNMSGIVVVGANYTLRAYIGIQVAATRNVSVTAAVVTEPEVVEPPPPPTPPPPEDPDPTPTPSPPTILTSIDGHEYTLNANPFPGTWESIGTLTTFGATSTAETTQRIAVGNWNGYYFKLHMKIGPVDVAKDATIFSANLNLSIATCYKYLDLKIQAVDNPNASDIGASNIISSQTLTTATVTENNSEWINSSATSSWVPQVNPKNIDVTTIVQEMVNNANWVSGDSIQFVIDRVGTYDGSGNPGGAVFVSSNESTAGVATTLDVIIGTGTRITSVSGDDVIELGEQSCTIIGVNIASASNLNISKGGISENQTILSNTNSQIVFNVVNGAIVADTGYTLSFDVSGTTYSTTVDFVTGGGINTGTITGTGDGHEYGATLPASGNPGTFEEENAATSSIFIGQHPFGSGNSYIATLTVGPITAQQNQTFTTADLTWTGGSQSAYKAAIFDIKAVTDPNVSIIGPSNLISSQTLTTAAVSVDPQTFTGYSGSDYWNPATNVTDITAVLEEAVSHPNWETGKFVQLVMIPTSYPSGSGAFGFGSLESGNSPSLSYTTAAATNIASIGASDIIRKGDTNIELVGSDLAAIETVSITLGSFTEVQTIVSVTDTLIVFDSVQGALGYGTATLKVISDTGSESTFGVTLLPALDESYVVLGTPSTGDASLTFNDSPAFEAGDIIEFDKVSANGFNVSISNTGVPSIQGGDGQDSFSVRGYDVSTGIWYETQTVTFLSQGYFTRNSAPFFNVSTLVGSDAAIGGDVVIPPVDPDPEPDPDPVPDPTPEPDPTPDPDPVPNPEPPPPTPDPTPDPDPEPEPEPEPEPDPDPTPDPTPVVPVEPVVGPTGEVWVIQDDTDTDEVWN